jgi:NTP pyrophosphatase (non-canonical NTP hydrolase)
MNLNEYQKKAMTFAKFKSLDYPFAGLAEESGEVLGKLAKAQRKWEMCQESVLENIEHGHFESMSDKEIELYNSIGKELGDVLWMVQACASVLNMNLSDIANENINKLTDRLERNVICGSGDDR